MNTPEPALIFFFPRNAKGAARVDISNAYVARFLGVDGTLYKGGLAQWQTVVLKTGLTASSERRTSCNFQDSVSSPQHQLALNAADRSNCSKMPIPQLFFRSLAISILIGLAFLSGISTSSPTLASTISTRKPGGPIASTSASPSSSGKDESDQCHLQNLKVSLGDLYRATTDVPEHADPKAMVNIGHCVGHCIFPFPIGVNASSSVQMRSLLRYDSRLNVNKRFDNLATGCCVPISFASFDVVTASGRVSIDHYKVKECGCR